jgi:hypothetical protein
MKLEIRPDLRQALKHCGVKHANVIPTLHP